MLTHVMFMYTSSVTVLQTILTCFIYFYTLAILKTTFRQLIKTGIRQRPILRNFPVKIQLCKLALKIIFNTCKTYLLILDNKTYNSLKKNLDLRFIKIVLQPQYTY